MIGVENICLCKLSNSKGEGSIQSLTGCTEPGTEWTRMAVRMMVAVIELVHNQVGANQNNRGEQYPCQHDHERQSEMSTHGYSDFLSQKSCIYSKGIKRLFTVLSPFYEGWKKRTVRWITVSNRAPIYWHTRSGVGGTWRDFLWRSDERQDSFSMSLIARTPTA